jgi:hypothetical protein
LDPSSTAASANLALQLGSRRLRLPLALLIAGLFTALGYLVASSPSQAGAAESFPGQGFLPDDRVWEMVSPPDKNGADIIASTAFTQPSAECGSECGISFASLAGFGDVRGFSKANSQYIARRLGEPGTPGWSTHGVTPPQEALTAAVAPFQRFFGYHQPFSADLSTGVFRAWSPVGLPDDPHTNVEVLWNLYVRDDLTSPGEGSYQRITTSPVPQALFGFNDTFAKFAAANAGDVGTPAMSTVLFQGERQFADAPPGTQTKLFVSAHGEQHFLTEIPSASDPTCGGGGPACSTSSSSGAAGVTSGLRDGAASQDPSANYVGSQRTVSDDGSQVIFRAPVGNNAGETSASRLYMRDDQGTADPSDDVTTRIQHTEKTTPETARPARFWFGTPDGQHAFITSLEGLVDGDDNGTFDLYRYTHSDDPANDDNLTRISVDSEGADDADVTEVIAASPSGDDAYFVATGELVSGQPALASGPGLYHWNADDGLSFIGEFHNPSDAGNIDVNTVRIAGQPTPAPDRNLGSRITPDGDLLFTLAESSGFVGVGGFDGYDHGADCDLYGGAVGGCPQLFLYSPADGSLDCVSCNPSGAPPTGEAMVSVDEGAGGNLRPRPFNLPNAISDDGRYVFFMTPDSLVPEDQNGPCVQEISNRPGPCTDVYEYDTANGQLRLLSSGNPDSGPSVFVGASKDGQAAYIATREQLSAWDTDGGIDIYAAVIDGGFPEPPVEEEPCESNDDCKGPASGGPADNEPGSSGFEGEGNVTAEPVDCSGEQQVLKAAKRDKRKANNKAKRLKRKAKRANSSKRSKKLRKKAKRTKRSAKKEVKTARTVLRSCQRGES